MHRGRVVLEAWEQRMLEEREAEHVIARCLWCDWQLAGDVKTTRNAHQQHRTTNHPHITVPTHRKNHRPHRQFVTAKHLDENIADARSQGAAVWAKPE